MDIVTDTDIATLATEAASAGDLDMVDLCEAALEGDPEAWETVRDAVLDLRLHAVWHGGDIAVHDPRGGVWWPSQDAMTEAEASDASFEAAIVTVCINRPNLGRWSC